MSPLRLLFEGKAVTTISVDSDLGKAHFRGVSPDARFLSDRQFRFFRRMAPGMLDHHVQATNETLCDGKRVVEAIALRAGMTIALGNSARGVSKLPLWSESSPGLKKPSARHLALTRPICLRRKECCHPS